MWWKPIVQKFALMMTTTEVALIVVFICSNGPSLASSVNTFSYKQFSFIRFLHHCAPPPPKIDYDESFTPPPAGPLPLQYRSIPSCVKGAGDPDTTLFFVGLSFIDDGNKSVWLTDPLQPGCWGTPGGGPALWCTGGIIRNIPITMYSGNLQPPIDYSPRVFSPPPPPNSPSLPYNVPSSSGGVTSATPPPVIQNVSEPSPNEGAPIPEEAIPTYNEKFLGQKKVKISNALQKISPPLTPPRAPPPTQWLPLTSPRGQEKTKQKPRRLLQQEVLGGGSFSLYVVFQFKLHSRTKKASDGLGLAFFLASTTTVILVPTFLPGSVFTENHFALFPFDGSPVQNDTIFAIEIDTNKDDQVNDIDDNHVGININSAKSMVSRSLDDIGIKAYGQLLTIWVDYNSDLSLLEVRVSNTKASRPWDPFISVPNFDIQNFMAPIMYGGFAARGETQEHQVLSWSQSTTPNAPRRPIVPANELPLPKPPPPDASPPPPPSHQKTNPIMPSPPPPPQAIQNVTAEVAGVGVGTLIELVLGAIIIGIGMRSTTCGRNLLSTYPAIYAFCRLPPLKEEGLENRKGKEDPKTKGGEGKPGSPRGNPQHPNGKPRSLKEQQGIVKGNLTSPKGEARIKIPEKGHPTSPKGKEDPKVPKKEKLTSPKGKEAPKIIEKGKSTSLEKEKPTSREGKGDPKIREKEKPRSPEKVKNQKWRRKENHIAFKKR